MSQFDLFVKRSALIGIMTLLTALNGIIMVPILTRSLVIAQYGVYVQVVATINLLSIVGTLGMPSTIARFLAATKKREEIQEGFYSILVIVVIASLVVAIVIYCVSPLLAQSIFNNDLNVARILPFLVYIGCLNLFLLSYFRTFQQIKYYSLLNVVLIYSNTAFVAYFALTNLIGILFGSLLAQLLVLFMLLLLIIPKVGISVPQLIHAKDYLSYGLPLVPSSLSNWTVDLSDRYIIGLFLGSAFVGYYSPGYSLAYLITICFSPIAVLLGPSVYKFYDENKISEVRTTLGYSLKYSLILAIPSAFALSILSKAILLSLSTPEIAAHGYIITPFVAAGFVVLGVYGIFLEILLINKKTGTVNNIWLIAALLNVVLTVLLVRSIGIIGAGIATLLTFVFILMITGYLSSKYLKLKLDFVSIAKSLIGSSFMSVVLVELNPTGLASIFGSIALSAAIYVGILYILRTFSPQELTFFKNNLPVHR